MANCTCSNFPASLGPVTFGDSVGIGTTSPNIAGNAIGLTVSANNGAGIELDRPIAGAGWGLGAYMFAVSGQQVNHKIVARMYASLQGIVEEQRGGVLQFGTKDDGSAELAERMRITPGGNVGVGTTTPSEKLEVNGNVKAAGDVAAAQNKRVKAGDANLSSGSSPQYHWAHLGVNVWYDGTNWQTDDPNRVKGLIQISNGDLSFFVSNIGTPVSWTRRFRVSEQGDLYVNEVKAINSQGYCLFAP